MLDCPDAPTHERIRSIVARLLARRSLSSPLTPDSNLRNSGLTSLDMVNLMLAIECEYDITIPQDAMTPENFQSIRSIDALVLTLQS